MKSWINELEVLVGSKGWNIEESNLEKQKIADVRIGSKF